MKLRTPDFSILAMTGHDEFPFNYHHPEILMETAGRTCYKSEKKITEDSAIKFVEKIKKNKHRTVLEHSWHARLYFDVSRFKKLQKGNGCKYLYFSEYEPLVVGNARAWEEAIIQCPELDELDYYCPHELDLKQMARRYDEPFLMAATVRVICDRGVSHELVRHRPVVFSQESTRYVNYAKKEIEFIEPFWFRGSSILERIIWKYACKISELCYTLLINLGWTPQMARSVLVNSLKTELVMTAPLSEWQHIFRQRALGTTGTPHPQMVELMLPIGAEFQKTEPTFFSDDVLFNKG